MPFLTSALIGAGVAAAGSIGGAAIGANAAGNAASTQANAANNAANLTQENAQAGVNFNEQQLNLAEQNSAPYRAVGQNSLLALNDLMGLTPVNPYPINAGGNTAPTVAGPNGTGATPGMINNPAAPPGAPVARWKGGPVVPKLQGLAQHYMVGEKGPEELTMFPNGTGWVTPHNKLSALAAIHREGGGPVFYPGGGGGPATDNRPPSSPGFVQNPGPTYETSNQPGNPAQSPANSSGVVPANQPFDVNNPGANNPLITGGWGGGASSSLNPFTSWTQQFQAPTAQQAEQYPGYQFQLQQGEQAIANNASASGELGDSNYGRALTNYAEQAGQSDYNNVYNQAMQQYQQNYNIFNNNQSNQFNRLGALAGIGQTSTNQLNAGGLGAANTNAGILNSASGMIGNQLNNAGAATASGYVGGANAWNGALGGVTNTAQMLPYLQYLQQQGGGTGGAPTDTSWLPQNPTPGQAYYPPGTP